MKRQRRNGAKSNGGVHLKLTTPTLEEPEVGPSETIRARIKRVMSENPVIIFCRPTCFMHHVIKSLLSSVGAHPTVIELEQEEVTVAVKVCRGMFVPPCLFIDGECVGGLESVVGLHLRNELVPRLDKVGALKGKQDDVVN